MVQYANPNSTISNNGWSITGAPTVHQAIDEGILSGTPDDGTTLVLSSTQGNSFIVGLETLNNPGSNNRIGHKVRLRTSKRGEGAINGSLSVTVKQGSTVIYNPPQIPLPLAGGVWTTSVFTIPESNAQNITDYTDLNIRVAYAFKGSELQAKITAVELEVPDPFDHLAPTIEEQLDLPASEISVEVPGTVLALGIDLPTTTREIETLLSSLEQLHELPASGISVEVGPQTLELPLDLPTSSREIEAAPVVQEQLLDLPAVVRLIEFLQISQEVVLDLPTSVLLIELALSALELQEDLPATVRLIESLQTSQEEQLDLPSAGISLEVSTVASELQIDLPQPVFSLEFLGTILETVLELPQSIAQIEALQTTQELLIDLPPTVIDTTGGGGGDVSITPLVQELQLLILDPSIAIEIPTALRELEILVSGSSELDIPLQTLEAVVAFPQFAIGSDKLIQLVALTLRMVIGDYRLVNGTTYYFQKDRIHNKLVSLAQLGLFFPAEYDKNSDVMGIDGLDLAATSPKSIKTNETMSRADRSIRNRTDGRRDRTSWTWELFLDFQEEVALEIFEKELLSQPPVLPKDDVKGLQQVTLMLLDVGYEHPPEHEATSGTQAKLTFNAALGPT